MRGSVIGNAYGTSNDKMLPQYFSDRVLVAEGYREATAQNGSTFYSWNGATYAEGIEISQGGNHQGFYMSAVTNFNNVMAIGFPYSGGIVFAPQIDIMNRSGEMYGAVTGGFGIIYNGWKNFMGSNVSRNGIFNIISGRSIIAEDDENWYSICFAGVTGASGLTGPQLYDLCIKVSPTMKNAICFDGGGSVFQRINGKTTINTSRLVKNAVLMYIKEPKEEPKPKVLEPGAEIALKGGAWNLDTGDDYSIEKASKIIVTRIRNHRIEFELDGAQTGSVGKEFVELV